MNRRKSSSTLRCEMNSSIVTPRLLCIASANSSSDMPERTCSKRIAFCVSATMSSSDTTICSDSARWSSSRSSMTTWTICGRACLRAWASCAGGIGRPRVCCMTAAMKRFSISPSSIVTPLTMIGSGGVSSAGAPSSMNGEPPCSCPPCETMSSAGALEPASFCPDSVPVFVAAPVPPSSFEQPTANRSATRRQPQPKPSDWIFIRSDSFRREVRRTYRRLGDGTCGKMRGESPRSVPPAGWHEPQAYIREPDRARTERAPPRKARLHKHLALRNQRTEAGPPAGAVRAAHGASSVM